MDNTFKIDVPEKVENIIRSLEAEGFEAYAVGGCVRDSILGRTPHDWDVTTSARPEEVKKIFCHTVDTGIQHGTVTVMMGKDGYEVTTYRVDGEYLDGRHPQKVSFTSQLSEDLRRRDLTINAMAYHPDRGLVDIFSGREDLEKRIIRCVGDARERLTEDALRMMRVVRFSAQLNFSIDESTREAIKCLAPTLKKVSHERIAEELIKLICSDHPDRFLDLYELGLTAQFFPEFDQMMSCSQNTRYHCYTVGMHTLKVMENIPTDKIQRLSALLHDVGKLYTKTEQNGTDHFYGHCEVSAKRAESFLRELKLDNDTIKKVCILVKYHDPEYQVTESGVRHLLHDVGPELMPGLISLMRGDMAGKSSAAQNDMGNIDMLEKLYLMILERGDCISLKSLAVNGNDLMAAGVPKGTMVGKVLNMLFETVLEEPSLNEREILLQKAKEIM